MHKCPNCGAEWGDGWLYNEFADGNHDNEFEVECPVCGSLVKVEAQSVPEFTVGELLRKGAASE